MYPTPQEVGESLLGLNSLDAERAAQGEHDLGTWVHFNALGYSEDLHPFIVIGEFRRVKADGNYYFDLEHFRYRLVLDCADRLAFMHARPFPRLRKEPRLSWFRTGIWQLTAEVQEKLDGTSLIVTTNNESRARRAEIWFGSIVPSTLDILVRRINYLWAQGKPSQFVNLPECSSNNLVKWKNPNAGLRESLETIKRNLVSVRP